MHRSPAQHEHLIPSGLTAESCYAALRARDARFDGRFFVGVSSTGIYCRPVCRVRLPLQRNCSFYSTAAAAEVAGFRPCLKCRPELAPSWSRQDASGVLAQTAAQLIRQSVSGNTRAHRDDETSLLRWVAARLGVSTRHLHRLFVAHFGIAPLAYAQTERLLNAKRLLTDTTMSVTAVAEACGFASVRRLHALFRTHYGFTPTQLRQRRSAAVRDGALHFQLAYRPPYDAASLMKFLAARAIHGVEQCVQGSYQRLLGFAGDKHTRIWGSLTVTPITERNQLAVTLSPSLAGQAIKILAQVRRVFDLDADPETIASCLGALAQARPGLRLPGAFDGFELAVRAVLGQQVTVAAARTLASRFVKALGDEVDTGSQGLSHLFPSPERISTIVPASITALGIVEQRAQAIVQLALALQEGRLDLSAHADPQATIQALMAIRGIGPWTAHYIVMRAMSWPDAWLPGDIALARALGVRDLRPKAREIEQRAQSWRPWRSYAVLHLWRRLLEEDQHDLAA